MDFLFSAEFCMLANPLIVTNKVQILWNNNNNRDVWDRDYVSFLGIIKGVHFARIQSWQTTMHAVAYAFMLN